MVRALMPIIIKIILVLCTETNERLTGMEVRFLTNITEQPLEKSLMKWFIVNLIKTDFKRLYKLNEL